MKTSDNFSLKQEQYFDAISVSHGKKGLLKESRALTIEFETLMRALGDVRGRRVLDLGCGTGRHALRVAKIAKEVVGTDISKKSIDLAGQGAKELGIQNFQGIVGGYTDTIQPASFDVVYMVNVVHHIDDIDTVFRNMRESLRENGRIVIMEFNPLNALFIPFLILYRQVRAHLNRQYFRSNLWDLRAHIAKSGLQIVREERYAYLPTVLYNYSSIFEKINAFLNAIPVVNYFCAFHIITCVKNSGK